MKTSVIVRNLLRPFLLTTFLIGCVGQQDSAFQPTSAGGRLYISNLGNSSLLIYGNAINTNGNLAPTENIHNLNAQNFILDPLAVFVDTTVVNGRLYVANTGLNQILIYNNASSNTTTGNAVPDRVISGANTTLNAPRGLMVDTTNHILYVSNTGSNAILVFDVSDASFTPSAVCAVSSSTTPTTTCDFTPSRNISQGTDTVDNTTLKSPFGIFVDTTPNNRLYVANQGNNSILVFNNAGTVNGNIAPSRTITTTLSTPRLSAPSGLFVDTVNDRLYVANNGNNSILIFNNPSIINGETIPDRVVSGGFTNLADPVGVFVDTTRNILYVTGDTNILAFDISDAAFNSPVVSSTATGGTSTTLTDTNQTFIPNQFVNFIVKITGGTGAGLESLIIGNDTNTLTVSPQWPTIAGVQIMPNTTSTYEIRHACTIGGSTVCNFAPSGTLSGTATTLSSPGGILVDVAADVLYAANPGNNSIVVFNNASAATGNVAPDRAILDTGAPLAFPSGISEDVARDLLYVTGPLGSITIFEHASTLENIPPPGPRTILPASGTSCGDIATARMDLCAPRGISVDMPNDQLYTANTGASSILVFNNASSSTTTGMVTPDRTILPASGIACGDGGTAKMDLCAPFGASVDAVNDRLYVANTAVSSILVFNNASSTTGMVTPDQTILPASGTACGDNATNKMDLCAPRGIFVDTINDRLYVANTTASSILVFDNASSITSGMIAPDRTILPASGTACGDSGTTKMDLCSSANIFVDAVNDLLYVANTNANSILVFNNASTVDGSVVPDRVIAKGTDPDDNTTLNSPFGVFVDTTR